MYHFIIGVFPNHYKKFDPKFTAVFHNSLPYPVDFYGVDFEGRKIQQSHSVLPGQTRTVKTTLHIPWVFKRSNDGKRLMSYLGYMHGLVFKGETFDVKNDTENHVVISDQGTLSVLQLTILY